MGRGSEEYDRDRGCCKWEEFWNGRATIARAEDQWTDDPGNVMLPETMHDAEQAFDSTLTLRIIRIVFEDLSGRGEGESS
jgi:hypothetical protein